MKDVKEPAPTEAVRLDSNDAHARSWVDVFRRHRLQPGFKQVRPLIGEGGAEELAELPGVDHESPRGKRLGDERRIPGG
jgi:hypothetical protein